MYFVFSYEKATASLIGDAGKKAALMAELLKKVGLNYSASTPAGDIAEASESVNTFLNAMMEICATAQPMPQHLSNIGQQNSLHDNEATRAAMIAMKS